LAFVRRITATTTTVTATPTRINNNYTPHHTTP
jgi:hypothetical protein